MKPGNVHYHLSMNAPGAPIPLKASRSGCPELRSDNLDIVDIDDDIVDLDDDIVNIDA